MEDEIREGIAQLQEDITGIIFDDRLPKTYGACYNKAKQIRSYLHKRGYQKREATLKEVGELLEDFYHGKYPLIATEDLISMLLQGKMPGEVK